MLAFGVYICIDNKYISFALAIVALCAAFAYLQYTAKFTKSSPLCFNYARCGKHATSMCVLAASTRICRAGCVYRKESKGTRLLDVCIASHKQALHLLAMTGKIPTAPLCFRTQVSRAG
jgi:hypothetical protein